MIVRSWLVGVALVLLASCASVPNPPPIALALPATAPVVAQKPTVLVPLPPVSHPASRWTAVDWADLPGFEADALVEAWPAWQKSCERAPSNFAPLCREVVALSLSDTQTQRDWLRAHLQPYRVEGLNGAESGLLTGYFEPVLEAARQSGNGFSYPLYAPPVNAAQIQKSGQPWYSRQEIDTLPQVRAMLRPLLWLADPLELLSLQIQGSGRLHVREADGRLRWVRVSFVGSNNHPYRSPGRWLLEQHLVQDASWPGIRNWVAQNPQRVQELLWVNPRVVFFREIDLDDGQTDNGPLGAQGVSLTPGRSIAVDPNSIPYGTPVWLTSSGAQTTLQKLVLAQDTGAAIVGAVRADYFTGWGQQAGELAGRLKQSLQLWVLWPK